MSTPTKHTPSSSSSSSFMTSTAQAIARTTRTRPRPYLTKSLFQCGVSCPRKLAYYATQRPRRHDQGGDALLQSLALSGKTWEAYAAVKRFPYATRIDNNSSTTVLLQFDHDQTANDALMDALVQQTRQVLFDTAGKLPRAVLQGAVRHEANHWLVRPDVLEYLPDSDKQNDKESVPLSGTLRITEIKAKSWNSRSQINPIWNTTNTPGIKADFLPYIHDLAFQTLVVQAAFPTFAVESFLLLPDKARTNQSKDLHHWVNALLLEEEETSSSLAQEQRQAAYKAIAAAADLTAWVDVTDAVQHVLAQPLVHPGSSGGATLGQVATTWAQNLQSSSSSSSSSLEEQPPPVGAHCKDCEFRLATPNDDDLEAILSSNANDTISGFDQCWSQHMGSPAALRDGQAVIDLWHGQKNTVNQYIADGKFRLDDLTFQDLGFSDAGDELDKKKKAILVPKNQTDTNGMSRSRRQLYQAMGVPGDKPYVLMREYMQGEMEKWQFPYHFVDFETSAPVLPYFAGMAPYEMVAFQYSHHILYQDGTIQHGSEFLKVDPGVNPNEDFLRALARSVGDCKGSVFRWGIHENTVLKSLLQRFDEEDEEVKSIIHPLLVGNERAMVDLQKIATLGYFVEGSGASSSIKNLLLPTMAASMTLEHIHGSPTYSSGNFTNMQWFQRDEEGNVRNPYDILKQYEQGSDSISDGGGALAAYRALQSFEMDDQEQCRLQSSLLRYCELDTLAMIMICQAWQEFLQDS